MSTVRTDIHRPSAIIPSDYEFVACDYYGPRYDGFGDVAYNRRLLSEHIQRTGGKFSTHEHGGSCHICGATALYMATFWHEPTNTYIQTGFDCADKMNMGDEVVFRDFRKRLAKGHEFQTGKNKAQKILTEANLLAAWDIYANRESLDGDDKEERTIRDIVNRIVRSGEMSEAQANFIRTLFSRIENRQKVKAEREAARAIAKDIPVVNGRTEIVGKVLGIKPPEEYSAFPAWKMLVEHQDGWKVWGTIPSNLDRDSLKGSTVRFKATIRPSNNDNKFGFFSRPTVAEIVAQEQQAA